MMKLLRCCGSLLKKNAGLTPVAITYDLCLLSLNYESMKYVGRDYNWRSQIVLVVFPGPADGSVPDKPDQDPAHAEREAEPAGEVGPRPRAPHQTVSGHRPLACLDIHL